MTNMDESKSGRALNSAEKAEADALTNKQWLYLICKSVQDDEEITGNTLKHETTDHDTVDARGRIGRILHWTERALGIAASISTVVALVFAAWQIHIGNWQFDRSGPRFSWFDTGLVSYTTEATLPDGLSGTGEVQAIVVSNTGRTGDTIVGRRQDTVAGHSFQSPNLAGCPSGRDNALPSLPLLEYPVRNTSPSSGRPATVTGIGSPRPAV